MKKHRQKNEQSRNEIAQAFHFIFLLGGLKKLCRQMPRFYHKSGRYHSPDIDDLLALVFFFCICISLRIKQILSLFDDQKDQPHLSSLSMALRIQFSVYPQRLQKLKVQHPVVFLFFIQDAGNMSYNHQQKKNSADIWLNTNII